MILFPAIDIRDGKCVRLVQGDYSRETVFANDPVEMAKRWESEGASWLHLVDLDGAKAGQPVNLGVVERIVQAVSIPCQLGGGFRKDEHLKLGFSVGLSRIIVGTRAIEDPDRFVSWVQAHPGKIALGLDVKNGRPAAHGWLEEGGKTTEELLALVQPLPLAAIIFTDVSRDGMMKGCNGEGTVQMSHKTKHPVIASGGIATLEELLELSNRGVYGAILGRSLYEGAIRLPEALKKLKFG